MGLTLPGELVTVLGMIGYDWPTSDEAKLFEMSQAWFGFADTISQTAAAVGAEARRVTEGNTGEAIAAFQQWWGNPDSAPSTLTEASTGATVLGIGLIVCAVVVLALKIQIIVQLVLLAIQIAQAIATAAATVGASLLEIPVFKVITQTVVGILTDQAISALLN
ncbi:hypothetical protein BDK92_0960 [Micromonospora pisi]|uniref:Outer membrane channel protein CpnT-like N-terminal domain-containing protein n=1 Tax=Micromonospora pisi TaxID=589240 RepID=A0A495JF52_9ACTN|nr:hypothetical protein [Micromonospora pisi]RKR86699.1 hypothetical protein BDK92_0960 [Micromonospora pisi]